MYVYVADTLIPKEKNDTYIYYYIYTYVICKFKI